MEATKQREAQLKALTVLAETGIPAFLWGPPGVGKTQTVHGWAKATNREVITLIGALLDPTDLSGIPSPSPDGTYTQFLAPEWLVKVCKTPDKRYVVFLDELNCAPASVTSAMLRLVNERAVHQWVMPEHTVIIAAGNDPQHVPSAGELSPAMQTRFAHIEFAQLHAMDAFHLQSQGWPVPTVKLPTASKVKAETEKWRSIIAGFTHVNPTHREDLTTNGGKTAQHGRGYPTPRSWDLCSQALGFMSAARLPRSVATTLAHGLVGEAPANEMLHYERKLDLPNPETWIANPKLAKPLARGDQTLVTMSALVSAVAGKQTPTRFRRALEAVLNVGEAGESVVGYPAMIRLVELMTSRKPTVKVPPELWQRINNVFGHIRNLDAKMGSK